MVDTDTVGVTQDRDHLPESEKLGLSLLHKSERLRKPRGRVLQAVGTLTEQVVCGCVESIPEEKRSHIDDPATTGRVTSSKERDELLHMLLKDLGVDNAIPHEHRTNKLARARPEFSIRGKDTVAQELLPLTVERLTLAVVGKLASQESLDILGVLGHNGARGDTSVQLGGLDICLASRCGDGFAPELDVLVGQIRFLARVYEVESCVTVSLVLLFASD